jgi:hypothetical protein
MIGHERSDMGKAGIVIGGIIITGQQSFTETSKCRMVYNVSYRAVDGEMFTALAKSVFGTRNTKHKHK